MAKARPAAAKHTSKPPHRWTAWLRNGVIGLLIAAGSLGLGGFVVTHWVERQILHTDNWVNLVGPLPAQPVVSDALGNYVVAQLFDSDAVQARIANALPQQARFLAGPLTNQLQSFTTQTAKRIVASPGFETLWTGANRLALDRLVSLARGQQPAAQQRISQKFNVDVSGVRSQLQTALASSSEAIPALSGNQQHPVVVTTNLHGNAKQIRTYVKLIDDLVVVLPLFTIACFLWAVTLAQNRRRVIFISLLTITVVILLELIAIKGLEQAVIHQVQNTANVPAVNYIYGVLVSWLRRMLYWVLFFSVLGSLVVFFFGPTRWARALRSFTHVDQLANKRIKNWWTNAITWLRHWQYYVILGFVLVLLIFLAAFVEIKWQSIVNALLAMLSFVALVRLLVTTSVSAT